MEFCKAEGLVLLADEVCNGKLLYDIALNENWASEPSLLNICFSNILFLVLDLCFGNPDNLGISRKCLCF